MSFRCFRAVWMGAVCLSLISCHEPSDDIANGPLFEERCGPHKSPPAGPLLDWFRDVTAGTGITVVEHSSGVTQGNGVTAGDIDGDGLLDLAFTAGLDAESVLYRNLGELHFERLASTLAPGHAIGLVDLDNDGDLDLVIAGTAVIAYENDGTGKFVERFRGHPLTNDALTSLHFMDVDNDGWLDILARGFSPLLVLRNGGSWHYTDIATQAGVSGTEISRTWSLASFDSDLDGRLDLLVTGDTNVDDPDLGQPLPAGLGDVLFRNVEATASGVPHFEPVPSYPGYTQQRSSMGIVVADFDHDNRFDLYTSNIGKNPLFLISEDNTFTESSDRFGLAVTRRTASECQNATDRTCLVTSWSAGFNDYDQDGRDDLIVGNGAFVETHASHFRGTEQGFEAVEGGIGCQRARSLISADLDNDGDLDVVITGDEVPVQVFRNQAPGGRGWLKVTLHGTRTNRQGLGAVVTARSLDGRMKRRALGAGGVVLGWNPAEAHFVSGPSTIQEIDVQWPSGERSTTPVSALNTSLVIEEPH